MSSVTEFQATYHYHDSTFNTPAVKLLPNEFYVTTQAIMLTTVLGSCVAACLRDPVAGVGGMNHFMLPENHDTHGVPASMRYGSYAMEVLINELLKAGAARERLQAKVFGGGAVLDAMAHNHIGARNADFVLDYLARETIPVHGHDLNGTYARRINYFPHDGRAMVRKLSTYPRQAIVARREQCVAAEINLDAQRRQTQVSIAQRPALAW